MRKNISAEDWAFIAESQGHIGMPTSSLEVISLPSNSWTKSPEMCSTKDASGTSGSGSKLRTENHSTSVIRTSVSRINSMDSQNESDSDGGFNIEGHAVDSYEIFDVNNEANFPSNIHASIPGVKALSNYVYGNRSKSSILTSSDILNDMFDRDVQNRTSSSVFTNSTVRAKLEEKLICNDVFAREPINLSSPDIVFEDMEMFKVLFQCLDSISEDISADISCFPKCLYWKPFSTLSKFPMNMMLNKLLTIQNMGASLDLILDSLAFLSLFTFNQESYRIICKGIGSEDLNLQVMFSLLLRKCIEIEQSQSYLTYVELEESLLVAFIDSLTESGSFQSFWNGKTKLNLIFGIQTHRTPTDHEMGLFAFRDLNTTESADITIEVKRTTDAELTLRTNSKAYGTSTTTVHLAKEQWLEISVQYRMGFIEVLCNNKVVLQAKLFRGSSGSDWAVFIGGIPVGLEGDGEISVKSPFIGGIMQSKAEILGSSEITSTSAQISAVSHVENTFATFQQLKITKGSLFLNKFELHSVLSGLLSIDFYSSALYLVFRMNKLDVPVELKMPQILVENILTLLISGLRTDKSERTSSYQDITAKSLVDINFIPMMETFLLLEAKQRLIHNTIPKMIVNYLLTTVNTRSKSTYWKISQDFVKLLLNFNIWHNMDSTNELGEYFTVLSNFLQKDGVIQLYSAELSCFHFLDSLIPLESSLPPKEEIVGFSETPILAILRDVAVSRLCQLKEVSFVFIQFYDFFLAQNKTDIGTASILSQSLSVFSEILSIYFEKPSTKAVLVGGHALKRCYFFLPVFAKLLLFPNDSVRARCINLVGKLQAVIRGHLSQTDKCAEIMMLLSHRLVKSLEFMPWTQLSQDELFDVIFNENGATIAATNKKFAILGETVFKCLSHSLTPENVKVCGLEEVFSRVDWTRCIPSFSVVAQPRLVEQCFRLYFTTKGNEIVSSSLLTLVVQLCIEQLLVAVDKVLKKAKKPQHFYYVASNKQNWLASKVTQTMMCSTVSSCLLVYFTSENCSSPANLPLGIIYVVLSQILQELQGRDKINENITTICEQISKFGLYVGLSIEKGLNIDICDVSEFRAFLEVAKIPKVNQATKGEHSFLSLNSDGLGFQHLSQNLRNKLDNIFYATATSHAENLIPQFFTNSERISAAKFIKEFETYMDTFTQNVLEDQKYSQSIELLYRCFKVKSHLSQIDTTKSQYVEDLYALVQDIRSQLDVCFFPSGRRHSVYSSVAPDLQTQSEEKSLSSSPDSAISDPVAISPPQEVNLVTVRRCSSFSSTDRTGSFSLVTPSGLANGKYNTNRCLQINLIDLRVIEETVENIKKILQEVDSASASASKIMKEVKMINKVIEPLSTGKLTHKEMSLTKVLMIYTNVKILTYQHDNMTSLKQVQENQKQVISRLLNGMPTGDSFQRTQKSLISANTLILRNATLWTRLINRFLTDICLRHLWGFNQLEHSPTRVLSSAQDLHGRKILFRNVGIIQGNRPFTRTGGRRRGSFGTTSKFWDVVEDNVEMAQLHRSSTCGGRLFEVEVIQPLERSEATAQFSETCLTVSQVFRQTTRLNRSNFSEFQLEAQYATQNKTRVYQIQHFQNLLLRRVLYCWVGVEIFLKDGKSLLLNLKNAKFLRAFLKTLHDITPNLKMQNRDLSECIYGDLSNIPKSLTLGQHSLTEMWVKGKVSNFDYLMFLNKMAGRTYNDLNQYFVFPWIISMQGLEADHQKWLTKLPELGTLFRDLTKPIGALNEPRFKRLVRKKESSENDVDGFGIGLANVKPFLYGSHYSTTMAVLYYLVRMEPYHSYSLKLNDARLDRAERMFRSVKATYQNCLECDTDFKELIPEFFYNPECLSNNIGRNLGIMQNGAHNSDVELPVFVDTAEEFVKLHSILLESPYVSAQIHCWIDMVFGVDQKADNNLFHSLTYEDNFLIESISDQREKRSIIDQIENFGQAPAKLFNRRHPKRELTIQERTAESLDISDTNTSLCGLQFSFVQDFVKKIRNLNIATLRCNGYSGQFLHDSSNSDVPRFELFNTTNSSFGVDFLGDKQEIHSVNIGAGEIMTPVKIQIHDELYTVIVGQIAEVSTLLLLKSGILVDTFDLASSFKVTQIAMFQNSLLLGTQEGAVYIMDFKWNVAKATSNVVTHPAAFKGSELRIPRSVSSPLDMNSRSGTSKVGGLSEKNVQDWKQSQTKMHRMNSFSESNSGYKNGLSQSKEGAKLSPLVTKTFANIIPGHSVDLLNVSHNASLLVAASKALPFVQVHHAFTGKFLFSIDIGIEPNVHIVNLDVSDKGHVTVLDSAKTVHIFSSMGKKVGQVNTASARVFGFKVGCLMINNVRTQVAAWITLEGIIAIYDLDIQDFVSTSKEGNLGIKEEVSRASFSNDFRSLAVLSVTGDFHSFNLKYDFLLPLMYHNPAQS